MMTSKAGEMKAMTGPLRAVAKGRGLVEARVARKGEVRVTVLPANRQI